MLESPEGNFRLTEIPIPYVGPRNKRERKSTPEQIIIYAQLSTSQRQDDDETFTLQEFNGKRYSTNKCVSCLVSRSVNHLKCHALGGDDDVIVSVERTG